MKNHIKFMKLAIKEAKKGIGFVNPNPLVGAVIVRNNKVISKGFHKIFGEQHAEINAIKKAKTDFKNCTIYITLEPCFHYGLTPPCVNEIIKNNFKKVVIGMIDPNPKVKNKSIELLKKNNIEVIVGVLEEECKLLNKYFLNYIEKKYPYITLKYAMTLDGKVATKSKESKWISNQKSLNNSQISRLENMAIMVGINTIKKDNPLLTCRISKNKKLIRIIADTNLKISLGSKVVKTAFQFKTLILTCNKNLIKINKLKQKKVDVILCEKDKNNKVDLKDALLKIKQMEIDSILVEGSKKLSGSLIDLKLVNSIEIYIGNKVFGGDKALSPIGGNGIDNILNSIKLINRKIEFFDDDILIKGDLLY